MIARIHGASLGGYDEDGEKDDTVEPEVFVHVPESFVLGNTLGELTSAQGHRDLAAALTAQADVLDGAR